MQAEGGMLGLMGFLFPSDVWWSLAFLGMAGHLPMGSGEGIPCFALLVHMAFAFPIKLLSQPTSVLTFTLLILSSIPLRGSECVAVQCLGAGWG